MKIQSMFQEKIDRPINGVVKVDQDERDVLVQELREYVITSELKKHFTAFFSNYVESFHKNTADIGVWISGFFGSGKSHFLKILSYLLENKEVDGVKTAERFREKLADAPETFALIERAVRGKTDTILFNIDIEGSINKDKTAVLRVFAKMFYNYLGFYGENLKVAKLEQFIEKKGKTAEFQRVFEEKNGASWLESRDAYAFFEDDIVAALRETLGMSEQAAGNWFNGTETVETSIAQLVSEIKEYVDSQPDDFRLLFMADEVGQYIGDDTDLLINLQSFVEKIGSECNGKVWVVCTGQEAIDEIIKARENEFSRIQARFKTRLSLSSSSADEVIQKRVLLKTSQAATVLENVYAVNEPVLRNLFSFTDAVLDIRGYADADEFSKNFPFAPYQFILMQKVFAEIRKHGNSGKHLSGGERSMLSGFQEAAQKIEDKDEYALAPFHLFYDTVHKFLDSAIRRVIERCERAAANRAGIEPQDVDALKLLYLLRYVSDDVKATLDNLVILMADKIELDKISTQKCVQDSLNRLLRQHYIGRVGNAYQFLTDEEQDIQREIDNTPVATANIVSRIGQMIFTDIYTAKKFRYKQYDFAFDQMVDDQRIGSFTGGMTLRVLTVAADAAEKQTLRLMSESSGQALVSLAETPYYENIERAMKIRTYVAGRDLSQAPQSVRDIIRRQQDEAANYERAAMEDLRKAIEEAQFYADGERLELKSGDAKSKIDKTLEYLVKNVYRYLGLITQFSETDADIRAILQDGQQSVPGVGIPNQEAAGEIERHLEIQYKKNLPTTMSDVQERFQKRPYGWREIDIAAVTAMLVHDQKVTVKYGGATIQPDNPKLPDMLRKKSETGKTVISKRIAVDAWKIREVREFLRDFFDEMSVPEDEDGLISHIVEKFNGIWEHYKALDARYEGHRYPDRDSVKKAVELIRDVLSQRDDNTALIQRVIDREDALDDMRESLQDVEEFFRNRVTLFDSAVKYAQDLRVDADYIAKDADAARALKEIRLITAPPAGSKFPYKRIPELNALMSQVKTSHEAMLTDKREALGDIVRQCMGAIHTAAGEHQAAKAVSAKADDYFTEKRTQIETYQFLALLDGLTAQMWAYKDIAVDRIKAIVDPKPVPPPPPKVKSVYRQVLFQSKTLKSEADIDAYLDEAGRKLKRMLQDCGGITLK